MLIVADENMPRVGEYFANWGELRLLPGRAITAEIVREADLLLVRSVTRVGRELLENSRVRFVGSATIGTDHLDTAWIENNGIAWCAAPGCNAVSVAEYVVAVVAHLRRRRGWLTGSRPRAGVIGAGNVGSRVAERLNLLGFEVFLNDPPRAAREPGFRSLPLEELRNLDLLCLHAPLERAGPWPSYHLVGEELLSRQKSDTVILSAGRGEVLDCAALKSAGRQLAWCLDVWEPEPSVDRDVLARAEIATPHVAGYALQARWRGTSMVHAQAARFFKRPELVLPPAVAPPVLTLERLNGWEDAVLAVYDPEKDTRTTKAALGPLADPTARGQAFDRLRREYPDRHEFGFPLLRVIQEPEPAQAELLRRLSFRFQ